MAVLIREQLPATRRPANNFKAAQRQKANEIFISLAFFVANRSPEGTYTNREVLLSGHPVSGSDLRPSRGRGAGFFDKKSKSGLRSVDLFSFFCIMLSEGVENMPEKDALAKRIKAYRRVQHMTQFDFSGETGLSVEEISHLEREETDPKLSTLQSLAAYMGVTVSDLLKIDET